jgi:hypothetical protein
MSTSSFGAHAQDGADLAGQSCSTRGADCDAFHEHGGDNHASFAFCPTCRSQLLRFRRFRPPSCHLPPAPLHRCLARWARCARARSLSSYLTVVHVRGAGGCNSTTATNTNGTQANQMLFDTQPLVDRMVGDREVASASQKVQKFSGGARSSAVGEHPVLSWSPILLSALLCWPRAKSVLMPL